MILRANFKFWKIIYWINLQFSINFNHVNLFLVYLSELIKNFYEKIKKLHFVARVLKFLLNVERRFLRKKKILEK